MALTIAQIAAAAYPVISKEMEKTIGMWSKSVEMFFGPVQFALPFTHEDWPEAVDPPMTINNTRFNGVRFKGILWR